MTTAHEMLAFLRAHYAGTPSKPIAGYLADEIQAPDSVRRADALWVPLDSYNRGTLIGHEIKVARSDIMAELVDPMKADAWAKYCDRWWLVVPDVAMLRGLEIPEGWGIMTPPSGRSKRLMTIVRPAPARKPNRDRDAYATVLARIFYNGDDQGSRLRNATQRYERAEERLRTATQRVYEAEDKLRQAGLAAGSPYAQKLEQRTRKVLNAIVSRWNAPSASQLDYRAIGTLEATTDDEVLEAIVDLARVRGVVVELADELRQRIRAYEIALHEPRLDKAKTVLQDLLKEVEAMK